LFKSKEKEARANAQLIARFEKLVQDAAMGAVGKHGLEVLKSLRLYKDG